MDLDPKLGSKDAYIDEIWRQQRRYRQVRDDLLLEIAKVETALGDEGAPTTTTTTTTATTATATRRARHSSI